MNAILRTLSVSTLAIVSFTASAAAQNTLVSPNRGLRDDIFLNPATDVVTTYFEKDRSYSCSLIIREFDAAVPKKLPIFNPSITAPDMSTISTSTVGTMKPAIAVPTSLTDKQAFMRISLIAPQTGRYSLAFDDGQAGGTAIPGTNIRCNDTTLYGGFNRFFADLAIVELSNDTSQDINAFITIIDFTGTKLIDKQAVAVLAGKRADVIFANLPAQRFGQVLVTYVGSIGALKGYVSEYDSTVGGALTLKRERPMEQETPLP